LIAIFIFLDCDLRMTAVLSLSEVLETYETPVDDRNYKTRVTIGIKDTGKKVKITETIFVKTVTRPIRNIVKFGSCAGHGNEPGVTFLGEEISIIKPNSNAGEPLSKPDPVKRVFNITCGKCGGEHFTSKCNIEGANLRKIVPTKGKYIPPSQRAGALPEPEEIKKQASGKYVPPRSSDSLPPSVRITNLPESITKEELLELITPFGPVGRVAIPNDKRTGKPRGFAFVSFHVPSDGDRAIKALDGIGYQHLILHLEWAKPRK